MLCAYLALSMDSSLSSEKPLKFKSGKKVNQHDQLRLMDGETIEKQRNTLNISLQYFLGILPYSNNKEVIVTEYYSLDNAKQLIKTGETVIPDSAVTKTVLDYGADVIFTCMFYLFFVGTALMTALVFKPANSLLSPVIWIFDMLIYVFIVEQWNTYGFVVNNTGIWQAATAIGLLLAIIALARFIISTPSAPSLSEQTIPALQTPRI